MSTYSLLLKLPSSTSSERWAGEKSAKGLLSKLSASLLEEGGGLLVLSLWS